MKTSINDTLKDESQRITFTRETLDRFKEEYNAAVEDDCDIFVFEEKEWVTNFAKYLIEYLEDKL